MELGHSRGVRGSYGMPRALAIVFALLAIILARPLSQAGDDAGSRISLKGLPGVSVLVESLSSEARDAGLNEKQILTDVELRLRERGVRLLSSQEWSQTASKPSLYVHVNVIAPPGLVAYNVWVALEQVGEFSNGSSGPAATWWVGTTGSQPLKGNVARAIRDRVLDKVEEFANAFVSAGSPVTPKP